jgi:hypothetical protein
MKRSGFARKVYAPPPAAPLQPLSKAPNYAGATSGQSVEKAKPVRSLAYRRLIAAMPCAMCGIAGYTQACHADEGKGLAMKACDLTCWPGCGPHDGLPGCHWIVGTSGRFKRDVRRELESAFAAHAKAALIEQARSHAHTAYVLRAVGLLPWYGGNAT